MNISIFDSDESEIEFKNKFNDIQSMIFIADDIVLCANAPWANSFTFDVERLSNEQLIAYNFGIYRFDKPNIAKIKHIGNVLKATQKVKNSKFKNKQALKETIQYINGVNMLKESIIKNHKGFIKHYNLVEINTFIGDGIMHIPFLDYIADPKKEDVFIQPIYQKMLERDNLFGLDEKLEEFFTPALLDALDPTNCDFMKIPLWEVPLAIGLSYNQIKYTRNDLQPALLPFKTNLKELSEALIGINFLPENMARIKDLCSEKLLEHITPVQQSLNGSLYLSHLRNQSAENTDSKLFLGIASAEMLMDYYEKVKLVQPYVVSEIKQQIQRHFDVKACCIFAYQKLHPSNQTQAETNQPQ